MFIIDIGLHIHGSTDSWKIALYTGWRLGKDIGMEATLIYFLEC